MTEAELYELILQKHPAPAWACFSSVRNGTGFSRKVSRSADALAMSLYPSRGLELHGFEIKCQRNDWLRELKDPEKAEDIGAYCDRWWIVAPEDLVKPDEVPPAWGHMIAGGGKLVVAKPADLNKAKTLDRPLLAAILRRAHEAGEARLADSVPRVSIEKKLEERYEAGRVRGARDAGDVSRELGSLQGMVKAFEEASGLSIRHGWIGRNQNLGEAVSQVLKAKSIKDSQSAMRNDLLSARNRLENLLHSMSVLLDELEPPAPERKIPKKPSKIRLPSSGG